MKRRELAATVFLNRMTSNSKKMGCCGSEARTWQVGVGVPAAPPEAPFPPTLIECILIRVYEGVLFPRLELGELFPRFSCLMEAMQRG